ncbi:ParB/RepB/Spo0J family partition protein [Paraburkholderia youngii]|uniref:ParB/RepB/Spo0J family partition protein n=1 Tax=Paraburkholderia youngii TaxID=2782701 RepID=UPI003D261DEA
MQPKTTGAARSNLLNAIRGPKAGAKSSEDLEDGLLAGITGEKKEALARADRPAAAVLHAVSPLPHDNEGAMGTGVTMVDGRPRIRIPVADCIPNPYNPRTFYDPASIDKLAVGMKKDGQMVAIAVTRLPRYPGKYVVVDGERRLRAKRSLDDLDILADVYTELSDQQLYEFANEMNTEREVQTVYDDAVAWKKLIDDNIFGDQVGLATALGKEQGHVSKVLSLNELPATLLQKMAANAEVVKLAHAYQLKLIFQRTGDLGRTEGWLDRVIAGDMTVKKLQDIAKRLEDNETATPRKAHYVGRNKFSRGGVEIGEIKRFDNGRMELTLNGLTTMEQAELNKELETAVQAWLERTEASQPADA